MNLVNLLFSKKPKTSSPAKKPFIYSISAIATLYSIHKVYKYFQSYFYNNDWVDNFINEFQEEVPNVNDEIKHIINVSLETTNNLTIKSTEFKVFLQDLIINKIKNKDTNILPLLDKLENIILSIIFIYISIINSIVYSNNKKEFDQLDFQISSSINYVLTNGVSAIVDLIFEDGQIDNINVKLKSKLLSYILLSENISDFVSIDIDLLPKSDLNKMYRIFDVVKDCLDQPFIIDMILEKNRLELLDSIDFHSVCRHVHFAGHDVLGSSISRGDGGVLEQLMTSIMGDPDNMVGRVFGDD